MKTTLFHPLQATAGAKFVPFAGYEMPIQYKDGILREHEWVRTRCGLFDVSHMGQVLVEGSDAASELSRLTPTRFTIIEPGRCKYTVLTNADGGIIDDLIVTYLGNDRFMLVINGACKENDIAWLKNNLKGDVKLTYMGDDAPLLALQGPYAAQVLSETLLGGKSLAELPFMCADFYRIHGEECLITRTGYTGEDGFEVFLPKHTEKAQAAWKLLAGHPDCRPIGLGARDSLRLEMGYPLYGNDIDTKTSPIEASISWVVSRKNSGYIGEDRIRAELEKGPQQKRVGILLEDKGIARDGAELYTPEGEHVGRMTSGGFSPTTKQAIGQGYIRSDMAEPGKRLFIEVRGRRIPGRVHDLSFVTPNKTKPVA